VKSVKILCILLLTGLLLFSCGNPAGSQSDSYDYVGTWYMTVETQTIKHIFEKTTYRVETKYNGDTVYVPYESGIITLGASSQITRTPQKIYVYDMDGNGIPVESSCRILDRDGYVRYLIDQTGRSESQAETKADDWFSPQVHTFSVSADNTSITIDKNLFDEATLSSTEP